jgi:hypothetical protein
VARRSWAPLAEAPQRADHRQQRDRRLVEPHALADEDPIAVGRAARGQLADEPALAHAGFAADEHEAGRALARQRHGTYEL